LAVEVGYLEVPTGPTLAALMVQTVLPVMLLALIVTMMMSLIRQIRR